VVHGADRPFFANIRELARPPEGIMPAGTFGSAPTICGGERRARGLPRHDAIAGTGLYNGSLGVNTDGSIFTDLAAPIASRTTRARAEKASTSANECTQFKYGLVIFSQFQVPSTKYNVLARTTYKLERSDWFRVTQKLQSHDTR